MRYLYVFLLVSVALSAQVTTYTLSNSGAVTHTQSGATLPASCIQGESYFLTSAQTGQNLYGCTDLNTWMQQGGSATPGFSALSGQPTDNANLSSALNGKVSTGANINSPQAISSPITTPAFNSVFYVDGFPSAGGSYRGAWSSATTYNRFDTVTYSGADYITPTGNSNITPTSTFAAGSTQYWVKFNSTGAGLSATQADCAFYWAYNYVQLNATGFDSPSGADLQFGQKAHGYVKNGDWTAPTNVYGYTISMHGRSRAHSWITQGVATTAYMYTVSFAANKIVSQEIEGLTFNAASLAGGCLSINGVRRSRYKEITCWNPQQQSGGSIASAMNFGTGGNAYEIAVDGVLVRTATYSGLAAATGTATVTGGAISGVSWSTTGTGLQQSVNGVATYIMGHGAGGFPCSTMPVVSSVALTGGGAVDTTVGTNGITFASAGSGCSGTIYVRVMQAGSLQYGLYLGGTDSTYRDLVTSGDFTAACEFTQHGDSAYYHEHPYCAAPYQIIASGGGFGGDNHEDVEIDSPIQYGVYITGKSEIFGPWQSTYAGNGPAGAGDFLINSSAYGYSIGSSSCSIAQTSGGYAKFTTTSGGPVTAATAPQLLSGAAYIEGNQEICDGTNGFWGSYDPSTAPDPTNTSNYVIVEDFPTIGGTHNWFTSNVVAAPTTNTSNSVSMNAGHPGVLQIATNAGAAGDGYNFYLGGTQASGFGMIYPFGVLFNSQWIAGLGTITSTQWRLGYTISGQTSGVPSSGVYFRFDSTLSDTAIQACVSSASVESCVSTGVTMAANTWHDYKIYSTLLGKVSMQVDSGSVITACPSGCSLGSNIPTAALNPGVYHLTSTTAASTAYYDYFKLTMNGLSR